MKWKELKDFCNSIPDEFIDRKVIMWREDEAINKIKAMRLEEDHYINDESYEDGCMTESEMNSQIDNDPELTKDDFTKVYDKGFPLLWEDF